MKNDIKTLLSANIKPESTVTIQGWVRSRRDSKAGISFLQVYDGSCFSPIQVVIPQTLPNYYNEILKLTAGCSVEVEGTLTASQGKNQAYEIQATRLKVFGFVEEPDTYPIQPKAHSYEYLREVAHLRARTNTFGALARIRQTVSFAIHNFFNAQGFYWLPTPIITANDCEGAGELFRISTLDLMNLPRNAQGKIDFTQDFFGKETFLTVSGQLAAETYALAISKVYTFGPTFRAENSNTSRHLAEFWMIEPEVAFADLQDNAKLAEKLLKHLFTSVLNQCQEDLAFFQERVDPNCIKRLENLVQSPFEHMEYRAAIKAIENANKTFEVPVHFGCDLRSEHERFLAEELIGRPVVLMNYPKNIKAFYMRLNDDDETVAAMDVLAPGIGEIIGGSQREERLEILETRLAAQQLSTEAYSWYLDLRRYGTVPHAGFGMGFERVLSYITGLSNVRDIIPFPRTPGHAEY